MYVSPFIDAMHNLDDKRHSEVLLGGNPPQY